MTANAQTRAERLQQVQKDAWIGDAVLALWVRLRILREDGALDGPKYARLTSNECLGLIAEPSETEARIGRAYAAGGQEQAFAWIEENLLPLFEKREANRLKKGTGRQEKGAKKRSSSEIGLDKIGSVTDKMVANRRQG